MPLVAILLEAERLRNVSKALESLAEEHPIVAEALITISGNIRVTATYLEVLVATRMGPQSGSEPAKN